MKKLVIYFMFVFNNGFSVTEGAAIPEDDEAVTEESIIIPSTDLSPEKFSASANQFVHENGSVELNIVVNPVYAAAAGNTNNLGGNFKKAYVIRPNLTEIKSWRELVRGVLTGDVAPAIKVVLTNLDRDLFRIFTPTTAKPPVPSTTTEKAVPPQPFQHEYPTEPSTNATLNSTGTTTPANSNDLRNYFEGAHTGIPGMRYKIVRTKSTTTTEPTFVEDDEDESYENLKALL